MIGMFLLIDKPQGWSSFDVVKKVKKRYPGEKVGHSGTLDPMATGLIILGIGNDTKKLSDIQGQSKSYDFEVDLSVVTDTWDMQYWDYIENYEFDEKFVYFDGKKVYITTMDDVEYKINMIFNDPLLPVPPFSAKKIGGKRMYNIARKNNIKNFIYENMDIYDYNIYSYVFPKLFLNMSVGSGTYIRSIAYMLGRMLSLGGTLSYLRRTSIGEYNIKDAYDIKNPRF